ncbi:hypothetical protein L873DRAFT_1813642 [Choiromyces venosus 120613-1]|uniref:Sphingolipid long chain base-responsive protein LSP1 n=1 Tax=Choiromyces venosus 120613-1 TaxID=1336337 RepID=A0A3N4JCZ7_9PEZI|nr:hypothetical protein L873DRAFT_1813642 [Choiromyces venosus 120613-1]
MAILPPPYTPRKSSPSPKRSPDGSRTRSLSVRSSKSRSDTPAPSRKHRFTFASLRGNYQPELSKRLFRLIKSENYVINAYESAGHERQSIATQLSEWGEQTGDDAVSELSDKLGVILTEIGAQEDVFAQNLEDYRSILKQIRNTESGVQPSRDHKTKVQDDIARLKYKEPTSTKLVTLEQELVRAEAENLVAEAQLTNVTRAKLKEAYAQHFAAVVERAEKQAILAKHGRRMLNLLNDTPVVPGDTHEPFDAERQARQILYDAEEDLRIWTLDLEAVPTQAHPVVGGVLDGKAAATTSLAPRTAEMGNHPAQLGVHPAHRKVSGASNYSNASSSSSSAAADPPYPISQDERRRREDMIVAC